MPAAAIRPAFDAAAKTLILAPMIRKPPPLSQSPSLLRQGSRLRLLTFAAVAMLVAALAFGACYLMRGPAAGTGRIQVTLGDIRLAFDADYARFLPERSGGKMEQVDLAAQFPDFAPAGEIRGLTPASDLAALQERVIFLTLTPARKGIDPSGRTALLYARFLEPEEWSHPGGLIMRRFVAGSPFANEDLYLTPPEGRIFAARCARPAASPDGLPDACLHEFTIGALNVQLRFSPARLADWEALTQGARQLVARMLR